MLLLLLQVVDQSRVRIKGEKLRRIRNKIGKDINVVKNDAAIAVVDYVFNATDVASGPVALVQLGHRVPDGFHGNWVGTA